MIYEFNAENITRLVMAKLVRELEDKDMEVEYANMSEWFTNEALLIVTCEEDTAKIIRARIWELNQGLCCDMHTITQQALEAYIEE